MEAVLAPLILAQQPGLNEVRHRPPAALSSAALREAAIAGGRYLVAHIAENGRYIYERDLVNGKGTNPKRARPYSLPRHAGTTYFLAELYRHTEEAFLAEPIERAFSHLADLVKQGGCEGTLPSGKPFACVVDLGAKVTSLGSSALTVVALAEYKRATGKPTYDELAIALVATDAVDDSPAPPMVLVSATSDADGRFSLALTAEQALRLLRARSSEDGPAARPLASQARPLSIVAYSRSAVVGRIDLSVTLDGLAHGYDVELRTTDAGTTASVQRAAHRVTGVLRDADERPVAGHRIEVLHARLRDEVLLASDDSGSDGSFRLDYDPSLHLGEGAQSLAIVVRALEDDGTGQWVERSPQRADVPGSAVAGAGAHVARRAGHCDGV